MFCQNICFVHLPVQQVNNDLSTVQMQSLKSKLFYILLILFNQPFLMPSNVSSVPQASIALRSTYRGDEGRNGSSASGYKAAGFGKVVFTRLVFIQRFYLYMFHNAMQVTLSCVIFLLVKTLLASTRGLFHKLLTQNKPDLSGTWLGFLL